MRFTIVVARHHRCWSNFSSSSSTFLSLSLVFRLYFVRIMFDESKSRPDQTWSRSDKSNKLILLIDWQQSSIHSNNLFMVWQPACLSQRMQFSMLALDCRSRTTETRLRSEILAWLYFLFLCHFEPVSAEPFQTLSNGINKLFGLLKNRMFAPRSNQK